MEASSGAHQWAREFVQFGHIVTLMAPKFVALRRMSGKGRVRIFVCKEV